MKKSYVLVIAVLVLLAVGITSCGFSAPSLEGTYWRNLIVGVGDGLHFITETTGDYEICIEFLGVGGCSDVGLGGFTYTYDAATQTGTIVSGSSTDFTISGNTLTLGAVEYKYESNP